MNTLFIYGGYILAALILAIGLSLDPQPEPAETLVETTTIAADPTVSPQAIPSTDTQNLQKKQQQLEELKQTLLQAQQQATGLSEEQMVTIRAEEKERVRTEMAARPKSDFAAMMQKMLQDEDQIRLRVESGIGVFLQGLNIEEPSYSEILDQLVNLSVEQGKITGKMAAGEISSKEASELRPKQTEKDILAKYLNEQQLSQYDDYKRQEFQQLMKTSAEIQVNNIGGRLSAESKSLVTTAMSDYYIMRKEEGVSSEQYRRSRLEKLNQIETQLSARLSISEMVSVRQMLQEQRDSIARAERNEEEQE